MTTDSATQKPIPLRAIAVRWLLANGYQGLCFPGDCGCDIDDLMLCAGPSSGCMAAYRFDCKRCMDGPDHNHDCKLNTEDSDYMMSTEADYCHPVYVGEAPA